MMNKYERFVSDLVRKTSSGEAAWSSISISSARGLFRDDRFIFRAFKCKWSPTPGTTIYFVEKQLPEYIEEHNMMLHESRYELSVVNDDGYILFLLDQSYVAHKILYDLATLIEQKSPEALGFFSDYE